MSDVSVTVQTTPISVAVSANPTVQVSATAGLPSLESLASLLVLRSETGVFYPSNNPSGYITGVNLSPYITTGQTGIFVTTGQTGSFITTNQTGAFYPASNPSGFVTGINISGYVTTGQTGIFVTTGQTGSFITTSQTGAFYPTTNPSGYITGVNLSAYITTGQTGVFVTTGQTGIFVTTSQTGSFVTTSQTGSFVTTSQTGAFVTSGQTGNFITSGQTGNFIISSGLTTNYIPLATNSNGLINSVIYQSGSNVGIGKTNPTVKLEVGGTNATDIIRTDNGLDFNPVILPTDVTLALISGSGNVNTGSHYYFCSYYTAIGETELPVNGSRPNITTTTNSGSVLVTLPISSDNRVIGRKLYRGMANSGYYTAIRLLATITNNTQSTFIDNVSDASLTGTNYFYNENSTCKYITVNSAKSMFLSPNNTTFGYAAGNNIGSTAQTSQCALFGYQAGRAITIGTRNTCIGDTAGYGVTAGGANTLLGYAAGSAIGVGGNNVVVGQNAMLQVGGDGNTLVGSNAAAGSPYGGYIYYNTCLGRQAGYNLSGSANGNTLIGYYAGTNNKIGATNICLGYYAGANLTSGSNNIIIGTQVEAPVNGGSNQLNIANLIFASGSAFAAGTGVSTGSNVGIRTSSPLAGLDVKGDCKFGSASTGNYTHFEADGSMKMYGTATVFEDIRIEPTVRGAGISVPLFEKYFASGSSNGVYLYSFADNHTANQENEIFFTVQMPHSRKSGSAINLHTHWVPSVAGSGSVCWGLEYTMQSPGNVFGNTTFLYASQSQVPAVQDNPLVAAKHYITKFADIVPDANQDGLSSILIGRLFRKSSDTVSDTYTNKVGLLYIDCHVEMDTLGSHEE